MENKKKEWYKLKFELTQMKKQMSDDKKGLSQMSANQFEDLVNDYFNVGCKFIYEVDSDRGHALIKTKENDWSAESITLDIRTQNVQDENGISHPVEYLRLNTTRLDLGFNITDDDRTKVYLSQLSGQIAESIINRDNFYDEVYHMLRNGNGVQIMKSMNDYYTELDKKCDKVRLEYMTEKIISYANKGLIRVGNSINFDYKLNDHVYVSGDVKFELNKSGKTYNVKWTTTSYDGLQTYNHEVRSKLQHVSEFIKSIIKREGDDVFNNIAVDQIPEEYQ